MSTFQVKKLSNFWSLVVKRKAYFLLTAAIYFLSVLIPHKSSQANMVNNPKKVSDVRAKSLMDDTDNEGTATTTSVDMGSFSKDVFINFLKNNDSQGAKSYLDKWMGKSARSVLTSLLRDKNLNLNVGQMVVDSLVRKLPMLSVKLLQDTFPHGISDDHRLMLSIASFKENTKLLDELMESNFLGQAPNELTDKYLKSIFEVDFDKAELWFLSNEQLQTVTQYNINYLTKLQSKNPSAAKNMLSYFQTKYENPNGYSTIAREFVQAAADNIVDKGANVFELAKKVAKDELEYADIVKSCFERFAKNAEAQTLSAMLDTDLSIEDERHLQSILKNMSEVAAESGDNSSSTAGIWNTYLEMLSKKDPLKAMELENGNGSV